MDHVKLVLMSCCAPCSCGAIKQLADGDFANLDDFIVLFYNPNIFPEAEYQKRLSEQIRFCDDIGVKYAVGNYDHNAWKNAVCGMEDAPERGPRCGACFKYRFKFAQNWAIENGYDAIASVLGVSRHKDQNQVDAAAADTLTQIKYFPVTWNEGLRQTVAHAADFYRQNYCGCEFSVRKV